MFIVISEKRRVLTGSSPHLLPYHLQAKRQFCHIAEDRTRTRQNGVSCSSAPSPGWRLEAFSVILSTSVRHFVAAEHSTCCPSLIPRVKRPTLKRLKYIALTRSLLDCCYYRANNCLQFSLLFSGHQVSLVGTTSLCLHPAIPSLSPFLCFKCNFR